MESLKVAIVNNLGGDVEFETLDLGTENLELGGIHLGTGFLETQSSLDLGSDTVTVGVQGVGIAKIELAKSSMESEGENIIRITLTNGQVCLFSVYNGKAGITKEEYALVVKAIADANTWTIKAQEVYSEVKGAYERGELNGMSAYEEAVANGFEGSKEAWLESLKAKTYITLVQDENAENIYNLIDEEGKAHGYLEVPVDKHVQSAIYDNLTGDLTFYYNDKSGGGTFSCNLDDLKNPELGSGLWINNGKLEIKIDEDSHEALSVSEKGLKLDGSHFGNSENELITTLYNNTVFPDY